MSQQDMLLDPSAIPSSEFNFNMFLGGIKAAMGKTTSRDLWMIDVKEIGMIHVLEGLNVRVKDAALEKHIRGLADSMKVGGFKASKPLEVVVLEQEGVSRIYLTDGHCRFAALKLALSEGATIKQIPCVTLPSKGITLQDLVAGLVTSNTGKPLTAYETALVCKRLFGYAWAPKQIGEKLGFSETYVNMLLELVSAPIDIVTMVQRGECSATLAVETMRKHRDKSIDVLKAGLATAKAAGKSRVTGAYIAGAALQKLVKKQASNLYDTAKIITQDPNYRELSEETRSKLDELLADIAKREKALEEKQQKAAAAAGDANEQQAQQGQEETQA